MYEKNLIFLLNKVENLFKFELKPDSTDKLSVRYSPIKDAYVLDICIETEREKKRWDSATYKHSNIGHKIEHDWKMCYLARVPGSESAFIEWFFDLNSSRRLVDRIELKFDASCYFNGLVELRLTAVDSNNQALAEIGLQKQTDNTSGLLTSSYLSSNGIYTINLSPNDEQFKSVKGLILRADLSRGHSDVAWQHTQLFRQSLNDVNNYPYEINFHFI